MSKIEYYVQIKETRVYDCRVLAEGPDEAVALAKNGAPGGEQVLAKHTITSTMEWPVAEPKLPNPGK